MSRPSWFPLLLGIWSVQEESTTTPFCVDELSFQPTYDGVLLQSKSSTSTTPSTTTTATSSTNLDDDTNVQICTTGSSSSTGFDDLPLYGKVNNKCTFHQDSSTTTLMFHSIDHANDRFPPSFQRIREQYQTLFLNNKNSIHIIGDSHQRYMYAGLVDLANHNCMCVLLIPIIVVIIIIIIICQHSSRLNLLSFIYYVCACVCRFKRIY